MHFTSLSFQNYTCLEEFLNIYSFIVSEIKYSLEEEKVVVLGGSFDPIHKAHLNIALESAKQVGAKKAIFVPAHISPLKDFSPKASDADRLAMLKLALEDFEIDSEICTYELEAKDISYSINTAKFLLKTYKNIYWIIGTDQYMQLHKWKDIQELSKLISFVLVQRPTYNNHNLNLPLDINIKPIISTPTTISSTSIREDLAKKKFLNVEIPSKLVLYIKENNLYQK